MQVTGGAAVTMSRGTVLCTDGRLQARVGHGRYVERPCFTDYARSQAVRNTHLAPVAVERQEFVP